MAPSGFFMQIRFLQFLSISLAILSSAASGDDAVDQSAKPIWEITIQSTVEWPPLAAPAKPSPKAKKEKKPKTEADAPVEMITERTILASLSGELRSIAGNTVEFVPRLGDKTPSSLSLESVLTLRKTRAVQKQDEDAEKRNGNGNNQGSLKPEDDTLRLVTFRSGSCVPGRLKRISTAGLVLAFGDTGELTVPLNEILSITPLSSKGTKFNELPPAKGRHVARLTTGEVITGNIAPVKHESDRLTITSPILSGEFPLNLIESILFPVLPPIPLDETPANEDEDAGRVVIVSFTGGATLTSPQISLSNGILELEIWKGTPFRIPLNSAENISFVDQSGIRPNGPIFVWGQHSDQADEFTKLQKTLEDAAIARELIVFDGNEGTGDNFNAALRRSTSFIWAEWENFDEAAFTASLSGDAGLPLDEQLQAYVRAGGIAIFLGMTGGTIERFSQLGLGEIKSSGSIGDGSDLELAGIGETLASVTDGEIKASNSTMMYPVPDGSDWSPLLVQPGNPENAAIIGRRMGSGWVFLMGMDFYETNDNITRILIELTQFRR